MTTHFFFLLTGISTALLWMVWILLLWRTNPVFATWTDLILVFAIFWVAVTGTLAIISLWVRVRLRPSVLLIHHVGISFRQSVLIGGLLTVSLVLLAHQLLVVWSVLGLLVLIGLIEWFFQRRRLGQQKT
ncbi:hypothetical protein HYW18_03060 [Candidatus Uhrbacteria bacterium]|nr:hypothetical protein [Candidatus Uhrbacteria bacterium]